MLNVFCCNLFSELQKFTAVNAIIYALCISEWQLGFVELNLRLELVEEIDATGKSM